MTIELTRGTVLNNDQLCHIFGCSPQGGMRRSQKTNTLVIVANHVTSIYEDRWVGSTFHYTGMGQSGDQSLTYMQNKTLAESSTNGVDVHLFEVDTDAEYKYQGLVALAGKPYQEIQPDQNKVERTVWVFPLMIKDGSPIPVTSKEFEHSKEVREKKAKKLSLEDLTQKAKNSPRKAGERTVTSTQRERDPYVSLLTKRKANGKCELCKKEAPFSDSTGEPYLETHHIVWLASGGDDTLENTVALCPNCHRKMHVLNLESDRQQLLALKIVRRG
jgi:5-methylcytosine-specific restriction protein A